jgi:DNA-binding IclR family transcriptional regulator
MMGRLQPRTEPEPAPMARSSPGVKRIVSILNFFADHPEQAFTLTDLVRALKLSRATCHALLAGLVESGYLYRTNDKSYVIGPTLVSIGRIANQHFSPLQVAQSEMRALADEFDAICSVFAREGDEVVVRGRAAAMSHVGFSIPHGARMKLRAPFGAIYYAWTTAEKADTWMDQSEAPPTAEQRAAMHDAMSFARDHGYLVGIRNLDMVSSWRESPERIFGADRHDFPVLMATHLASQQDYLLASVLAPIFDVDRQVVLTMGLMGFGGNVKGTQVQKMGVRLRAACDRITSFIAGKPPG